MAARKTGESQGPKLETVDSASDQAFVSPGGAGPAGCCSPGNVPGANQSGNVCSDGIYLRGVCVAI